jgi:hypothetical protein
MNYSELQGYYVMDALRLLDSIARPSGVYSAKYSKGDNE